MGHPGYEVTVGRGDASTAPTCSSLRPTSDRSSGLFLCFQYPYAVPGVTVANFLRTAVNAHRETPIRIPEFRKQMEEAMKLPRGRPARCRAGT